MNSRIAPIARRINLQKYKNGKPLLFNPNGQSGPQVYNLISSKIALTKLKKTRQITE